MTGQIGAVAILALACAVMCGEIAAQEPDHFSGRAAYYTKGYKGLTASGEQYDPDKFTAAHRTLPFGTRVLVTDPRSHRSVVVIVNDRGPFNKGLVIDLSLAAAKQLRMVDRGLIKVTAAVQ